MSKTYSWDVTFNAGSETIFLPSAGAQSNEGAFELDVPVDDGQTDKEVTIAFPVADLRALLIVSDQDVTLETNDGTTPTDTIALQANQPLLWHADDYHACVITGDVSAIYLTNASGTNATVKIRALYDATPT